MGRPKMVQCNILAEVGDGDYRWFLYGQMVEQLSCTLDDSLIGVDRSENRLNGRPTFTGRMLNGMAVIFFHRSRNDYGGSMDVV
jgi:hypothetical protein